MFTVKNIKRNKLKQIMNLPNKPKVLAATYNPVSNTKMISFLVDFPTVLLAELRTHRIITQGSLYEHMELDNFNMSANSARAIPQNKYLEKVLDNPYIPIWTKQQKGMSGELITDKEKIKFYDNTWKGNLQTLIDYGIENYTSGENVHKQNVNRLLAPFAYTTCILTGTEWENFFLLRCPQYYYAEYSQDGTDELISEHYFKSKKEYCKYFTDQDYSLDKVYVRDVTGNKLPKKFLSEFKEQDWQSINKSSAQPEFQVIAEILYDLYQEADWKESKYHIPFIQEIWDNYELGIVNMLDETNSSPETFNDDRFQIYMRISASMCAKLSYNTQDNIDTLEKHLERANILMTHKHQEPFSHQAIAMDEVEYKTFAKRSIVDRSIYNKSKTMVSLGSFSTEKEVVEEYGKCYNLTGFISQRYILENY